MGLAGSAGIVGCGGTATSPLASGGAKTLYVIQDGQTGDTILTFPANGNGTLEPSVDSILPTGMLPYSLATDSTGQLYVGGTLSGQYAVMVFAAGATSFTTPVRTILLGASSPQPLMLAVDGAGQVYVGGNGPIAAETGALAIFPAGANGLTQPARLIEGAATGLGYLSGLAVDSGGTIYVASNNGVTGGISVFGPTATGNATPSRVIANVGGVSVDGSGNIYGTQGASVMEFGPASASPIRTIGGSASGLSNVGGLQVDAAGDIYVANLTPQTTGQEATTLLGFGPTASGNQAPVVKIGSPQLNVGTTALAVH